MTAYASRRRRRPHLFVCVMLLVMVSRRPHLFVCVMLLVMVSRRPHLFVCVMLLVMVLEDVIGPDDCPINYVATLAAFLARLRLQKSDISPRKTQSYPRENFWATSSLRMVFVLTMTKSLPCLAFLCLRTSNSPAAAYVMVLVTTSRLCLT